jgi:hypothetical protein
LNEKWLQEMATFYCRNRFVRVNLFQKDSFLGHSSGRLTHSIRPNRYVSSKCQGFAHDLGIGNGRGFANQFIQIFVLVNVCDDLYFLAKSGTSRSSCAEDTIVAGHELPAGIGRSAVDLYLCFLDLIGSVFSLVFIRDIPLMNDLRINGGLKKSVVPFGLLSDPFEIGLFGLHRDAEAVVGECGQTQPLVVSRIEVGQP